MVKLFAILMLVAVVAQAYGEFTCSVKNPIIPEEWKDMADPCITGMRDQIQKEIDASFTYLAMGAYFSRDTVNRPGFAEHFFKAAKEEREHGSKLIEYLSMRGALKDVTQLISIPVIEQDTWVSGAAALRSALNLETEVTKSIRKLIKTCENSLKKEKEKYNDYHLVDYLTGVYLTEQLEGQRELAGKLVTLEKMMYTQGALGEFLFDKNM